MEIPNIDGQTSQVNMRKKSLYLFYSNEKKKTNVNVNFYFIYLQ